MLTASPRLDERDLEAIANLERRVVAADGGRLKLEWSVLRSRDGTQVNDFLWRADERVVGFCGIYGFGREPELAGMVDPAYRRQGIGSTLLAAAAERAAQGAQRALLVTPRTTPAGRAFARAHGGTLDHSEHFLVLGSTPAPPPRHPDVVIRDVRPADWPALRQVTAAAFQEDPADDGPVLLPSDRQLVVERAGTVIGAIRLSGDADTTGIYGFAVDPSRQGQGIGRVVLARVCAQLRESGVREVTLEVAVDNDAALGLYTSLGFEQRATEDYYSISTRRSPRHRTPGAAHSSP